MPARFRRFEILLPLRFNDGAPVPPELIAQTLAELREASGAVSSETQTIRGDWRFGDALYKDEMVRIWIDVQDSPDAVAFFAQMKPALRRRFQQFDLYMVSYAIEVL